MAPDLSAARNARPVLARPPLKEAPIDDSDFTHPESPVLAFDEIASRVQVQPDWTGRCTR
jgi:hypothetical protein